jgi:hypothetical protein
LPALCQCSLEAAPKWEKQSLLVYSTFCATHEALRSSRTAFIVSRLFWQKILTEDFIIL